MDKAEQRRNWDYQGRFHSDIQIGFWGRKGFLMVGFKGNLFLWNSGKYRSNGKW